MVWCWTAWRLCRERPSAPGRVRTCDAVSRVEPHRRRRDETRPRDGRALPQATRKPAARRVFGCVGVPLADLPKEDIYHGSSSSKGSRFEFPRAFVPLLTTATCFPLDGSTKALRPRALRIRHSLKTRKTARLNEYANMFPLVPALILAFVSFISSAFVILRILIPILPPHPLSRRVRPVSSFAMSISGCS